MQLFKVVRKLFLLFIFISLLSFNSFADEQNAIVEKYDLPLLSILANCQPSYCSSIQTNAYYKQCGDTTYKYFCPTNQDCTIGSSGAYCSSNPSGQSCTPNIPGVNYFAQGCSAYKNSVITQYQNMDCSITSSYTDCKESEICVESSNSARCQASPAEITCQQQGYKEGFGDSYCGIANPDSLFTPYCDPSNGLVTTRSKICDNGCENNKCISSFNLFGGDKTTTTVSGGETTNTVADTYFVIDNACNCLELSMSVPVADINNNFDNLKDCQSNKEKICKSTISSGKISIISIVMVIVGTLIGYFLNPYGYLLSAAGVLLFALRFRGIL